MDLGSFHSPVKQEPPKAVIANAVVAAGNPPPSGGGGRQCELDEADEPRLHGKPFCSYVLQRVLEEARRVWRG